VPDDNDQTVYLVPDDFGKPGRAWAQAENERADLEAVVEDLLTGQYSNPIRVVAFNTAEGWSEDDLRRSNRAEEARKVKEKFEKWLDEVQR
jgi:hypothetical protein